MNVPAWAITYPDPQAVEIAASSTLHSWLEHLPQPKTVQEMAVLQRIQALFDVRAAEELDVNYPEIAARMKTLFAKAEKITGQKYNYPGKRQ